MDIINFYKEKVARWNAESKCGFCYSFGAPLTNSAMNIQQLENCCLNVFITNLRLKTKFYKNTMNNKMQKDSCIYAFDLWFLKQVPLGLNNYIEISGYSIDDSIYESILKPLLECFGCGDNQCESDPNFLGYTKYEVQTVLNYLDNNFCGIKCSVEVEIKK
jgi:hypothetical protein